MAEARANARASDVEAVAFRANGRLDPREIDRLCFDEGGRLDPREIDRLCFDEGAPELAGDVVALLRATRRRRRAS